MGLRPTQEMKAAFPRPIDSKCVTSQPGSNGLGAPEEVQNARKTVDERNLRHPGGFTED
jgi:hypothetical protein